MAEKFAQADGYAFLWVFAEEPLKGDGLLGWLFFQRGPNGFRLDGHIVAGNYMPSQ